MITKDLIDGILAFDGGGLPVVSLYLGLNPADRGGGITTRTKSLLQQAHPLAEARSAAHEVRLSVRGDLQRIEDAATRHRGKGGAVVWFSCSGAGFFAEITLPRKVRDQMIVDRTPWVRPLLAVLDEYHRSCVVVIDKREATLWELYQNEIRRIEDVRDRTLRRTAYGGWAGLKEYHVRNKADTLVKGHFRRTATLLDELFRSDGYELLIIGGHEEEVPPFQAFLPKYLRPRLAGTFPIDTSAADQAEIRSKAQVIVDGYEREDERRQVAEVLEKAATGGFAALGAEDCLWAGSVAAVRHLLIQNGVQMAGVVCDESGWLSLTGQTCPLCGHPTRSTPDVLDELAETVIDEGGSVEHVKADTDLRKHGVAAFLRFPLPLLPEEARI
jgi:peptide subunit release factor 1 (eRF1)